MQKTRAGLIATAIISLPFNASGETYQAISDDEFTDLFSYSRSGEEPPDIAFLDQNGDSISLAGFGERLLVVNFWASWCAPCIAEMPALDNLNRELKSREGVVIAINTDFDFEIGRQWLDQNDISTLGHYWDNSGNAFFDAGGSGLPYTLIISAERGIIAEVFGDAPWDIPEITNFISSL